MIPLLLPLIGVCLAQIQQKPFQSTSSNPLDENFAKLVHSTLAYFHVPAVSIAVIHNDNVYSNGYGTAVFPNVNATAETMYYVGSTTKSHTAAALSLLMDDLANTSSAFGWKTPVSELLRDDFVLSDEYITTHATLEDLASHRTGFPRHDLSYGTAGQRNIRDTVRNMRNLPFTAGFRETYQYCNYMWATLGHIVETLTGASEGTFLRDRLWSVLGMNSTYWNLSDAQKAEEEHGKQLARGYTWDAFTGAYYSDPYIDIGPLAGAGSMISTVLDYSRYLSMMLSRSRPLSPDAHSQLRRSRTLTLPDIDAPFSGVESYTLGWFISSYRGVNIISHGGGLYGFGAHMAYVPQLGWGIAMMGNTAGTSNMVEQILMFKLLDDLLDTPKEERFDWVAKLDKDLKMAEEKLNKTREEAFGVELPRKRLPSALELKEYEGHYWSEGYKWLNFSVETASPRIPPWNDKPTKVLRASAMDRVWPGYVELEHVSGEFFVAWVMSPKGEEGGGGEGDEGKGVIDTVYNAHVAEFRIGANGKPYELGIALEESMQGKKIWFRLV